MEKINDKSTKDFFDLIINNNPELICRYSLSKKIEFINNTIFIMTGMKPESFINKSIHDFGYPPEFMNDFEKGFDDCVNSQHNIQIIVSPIVGPLAKKHFDIQFVPIIDSLDNERKIIGVFSISKDITEQKNLEIRQAQQITELEILSQRIINKANKLQNFAYIVSHNLRAPAAGILTLTSLLENANDKEEELTMLSMLKKSAMRLNETIEDLSETVRINQNINITIEEIAFSSVLNHIKESLAPLILGSETTIVEDFTNCPTLQYHKVYLESILHNFITNSIKYKHSDRKPIIHLKTEVDQDGIIKLICMDNGLGIDLTANGASIFGLHKTFHGNNDARGVGLFITKTQVEAMGGSISVRSEVGVGTTFCICFNKYK